MTAHSQLQIDMIRVVHYHSTFESPHEKQTTVYWLLRGFKHTDKTVTINVSSITDSIIVCN